LQSAGQAADAIANANKLFDPKILTLGFARRFATYKRPNLLLRDPQRLLRLLTNPNFPVQLILSGKAHPGDKQGQQLIKEWIHFIRQNNVRFPAIFLVDYDMYVSENLVQGVDVWINTPRRPWEASGTSGMKVLVNGGINLSVLDGWWAEAYNPQVGWALGDGLEHTDEDKWDAIEAEQLYNILEQEIVPEFYTRNSNGIPTQWVSRMRESMAQLTPRFSADRTVREYTEQHYLPAAIAYLTRAANKSAHGKHMIVQSKNLFQNWETLSFGEVKFESNESLHQFTVQVFFNYLNFNNVNIELYANGLNDAAPQTVKMIKGSVIAGTENAFYYHASFSSGRSVADYTIRAIPCIAGINVPLELPLILWQK
jgi:starch phosphorylase